MHAKHTTQNTNHVTQSRPRSDRRVNGESGQSALQQLPRKRLDDTEGTPSFGRAQLFTRETAGFSLVETIVAIGILLLVLSTIMSAIYTSSGASDQTRDQITAHYLAQDAIEYMRWHRDTVFKESQDFDNFTEPFNRCQDSTGGKCRLDTRQPGESGLGYRECSDNCEPLRFDDVSNVYGHNDDWEKSQFTRFIQTEIKNDLVRVEVTVESDNAESSVTVTDYLYNWNKNE